MADKQQQQGTNQAKAGDTATNVPNVDWDDTSMSTTYANVVNGFSTREEVTLFFGTNQTWNPQQGGDLKVLLHQRIIMSPYAAKRLNLFLDALIKEYERRHGDLRLESRQQTP